MAGIRFGYDARDEHPRRPAGRGWPVRGGKHRYGPGAASRRELPCPASARAMRRRRRAGSRSAATGSASTSTRRRSTDASWAARCRRSSATRIAVGGALELDTVSLPLLAALAVGQAPTFGGGGWSDAPFSAALPPGLALDLSLKAAELDLGLPDPGDQCGARSRSIGGRAQHRPGAGGARRRNAERRHRRDACRRRGANNNSRHAGARPARDARLARAQPARRLRPRRRSPSTSPGTAAAPPESPPRSPAPGRSR